MFDLQDILLEIHESVVEGSITDVECENLIELAIERYADNYMADFEAYYLEGFADKLAKKMAKKSQKKLSQDEVDDIVQEIRDKDGDLTERDKSKVVKLIIAGSITLATGLALVGYENRDSIIAAIDNHRARSMKGGFADQFIEYVSECVEDDDYTGAKLALYEAELCDMLSESTFDLIYQMILEAEKDHKAHMLRKEIAGENADKDLDKLPNKKFKKKKDGSYVDPEKTKREEMKYDYRDSTHRYSSQNKQIADRAIMRSSNPRYNTEVTSKAPTESDKKMLQYMRKQAEKGDPEAIKKYKQVFKMFCQKHGIKKDASLYVQFDPDNMKLTEWDSQSKVDSKKTQGKENIHVLPKGYMLIHRTPADKIKELKPKIQSNQYIGAGSEGASGQFHDTGRVYFVLQHEHSFLQKLMGKKDNRSTGGFGPGNHVYKLISPISGFYVDGENGRTKGLDKSTNIEKFIGKAVFVKTDKPLKVRQLQ